MTTMTTTMHPTTQPTTQTANHAIPFPPPPEPGWYADDPTPQSAERTSAGAPGQPTVTDRPIQPTITDRPADPIHPTGPMRIHTTATSAATESPVASPAYPAAATDDWDGTVLSRSSAARRPAAMYALHNEATGQSILIDGDVLLGRRPSDTLPQGVAEGLRTVGLHAENVRSVRIDDPTRTTSRDHAAIVMDRDGGLWIEDCGSLNGTFIIREGREHQVLEGSPSRLEAPATLRIGDQFLTVEQRR